MFPSSFSGTKKFPSDSGASATVRTLEATYSMAMYLTYADVVLVLSGGC